MGEQEAIAAAMDQLGETDPEDVTVCQGDGHSGFGWYAWSTEYPEDGSVRVDDE